MTYRLAAAFALCALPLLPVPGFTQGLDLRVGAGRLSGDTTYSIGGELTVAEGTFETWTNPISELKWPLDVWMASAGISAEVGPFIVSGEAFRSFTGDAGEMEDSDWGVFYVLSGGDPFFSSGSKDIFSASDTDLDAIIFDLKARYWFFRGDTLSFAAGGGWLYQNFDFEAERVNQYSPSAVDTYGLPSDPFAFSSPERVVTYEVAYSIPYLEVATAIRLGEKFRCEAFLGYSPIAAAEDEDHHLLRDPVKISEGSTDGSAWAAGVDGRYSLTRHWFAALGLDYLFIDTEGRQEQFEVVGTRRVPIGTIDTGISSSRTYLHVEGGYAF